jgi:hypothetical protein
MQLNNAQGMAVFSLFCAVSYYGGPMMCQFIVSLVTDRCKKKDVCSKSIRRKRFKVSELIMNRNRPVGLIRESQRIRRVFNTIISTNKSLRNYRNAASQSYGDCGLSVLVLKHKNFARFHIIFNINKV